MTRRAIEVVVFDVGETLADESRAWTLEAKRAGVVPFTFFAALGALIERDEHHRGVWELVGVPRPAPPPPPLEPQDLYPDALPTLERLRAAGYRVGVAGSQPAGRTERLALDVDFVASSAAWGVEKPDPLFFAHVAAAAGVDADRIVHVGDRVDNDVLPAREAGMFSVHVRRGPWGHIHARRPEAARADAHIDGLDEIPDLLASL